MQIHQHYTMALTVHKGFLQIWNKVVGLLIVLVL